ncbi:hypothetical protein L1987_14660 [Smallanthus sonchifolius]|uniref:Uncharacterized protein n=1 Tax=Smallanthus sonchifolius TaxID=185202 RepID=A0ACB9J3Z2_9ASTR|nr:hypothetical protein L1987_14660 [Smallanthus sonchifolius]
MISTVWREWFNMNKNMLNVMYDLSFYMLITYLWLLMTYTSDLVQRLPGPWFQMGDGDNGGGSEVGDDGYEGVD